MMNQDNNSTRFKQPASEKKRVPIRKNKRVRLLILTSCVILLCVAVYVTLRLTILKDNGEAELPTIGNHGESMEAGKPFVIEPIQAADISGIRVKNAFGGFYYYLAPDGEYYFEDAEAMLYDTVSDWNTTDYEDLSDIVGSMSMIDSLFGISRYLLATAEVVGYDPDNLAGYGLADDGQASMTVTHKGNDGELVSETVIFGNLTVSGGGYYCMYEGRDAVYVVADSTISRCIFTNVKSYFIPLVAPTVSISDYMNVSKLSISKSGDEFLSLRKLNDEEFQNNGELFTHILTSPKNYFPSAENLEILFNSFVNFTGTAVCEYNISKLLADENAKDELADLFRLYSLLDENNKWVYSLYYQYENSFNTMLYVSEKLQVADAAEGETKYIYYVYSPDLDIIAEFNADSIPWLEWDLLTFIDNHSFITGIDNVASMSFSYGTTHASFALTGEGEKLKVSSSTGIAVDTDNFRQLYKAILFATMDGYAATSEDATLLLSIHIKLTDGREYDYQYFGMTARKAYYTLNGSGEFYINRDYVKQIISACTGILNGETVTVTRKN